MKPKVGAAFGSPLFFNNRVDCSCTNNENVHNKGIETRKRYSMTQELKLKKLKSAEWLGNGFGAEKTDWTIVGHENVFIRNYAGMWHAHNDDTGVRIASADTRKVLIKILQTKIS